MSSSDSDDDCYGNAAKRLQMLKAKYVLEKLDVVVVDDDADYTLNRDFKPKKDLNSDVIVLDDIDRSINSVIGGNLSLNAICARNTKTRRGRKRKGVADEFEFNYERETRGSRKKSVLKQTNVININEDDIVSVETCSATPKSGRRGRGKSTANSITASASETDKNRGSPRVRGRGSKTRGSGRGCSRGRARSTRQNQRNAVSDPIINIGDVEDYHDMCGNQELFTSKANDVEIIEDNTLEINIDNEELSFKVYWQNREVYPFRIRKHQKLTQVFKFFSEKENVGYSNLLFMYNNRIIKDDDTPDSINYNITEFIDGGIVDLDVTTLGKLNKCNDLTNPNNGFKIKFQCQSLKRPFETRAKVEDSLATPMMLCAEHLELPIGRLKFYFDGDLISSKNTPQELGLDSGDCIDVKMIS